MDYCIAKVIFQNWAHESTISVVMSIDTDEFGNLMEKFFDPILVMGRARAMAWLAHNRVVGI